jgi:hypothetical protein
MNIGPHRLEVGDIHYGSVERVMGEEKAHVIYSDPPWGPGLLQMFATMNEPGSSPVVGWAQFLATFCAICAAYRAPFAPVFVEMGVQWVDQLDGVMGQHGLRNQRRWAVTYGSKKNPRPSTVSLYGEYDIPIDLPSPPHGEPVTKAILSAVVKPGDIVLDPCTGLGMTARITHKLGGHFRGAELNPKRMEATVAWLRSRT